MQKKQQKSYLKKAASTVARIKNIIAIVGNIRNLGLYFNDGTTALAHTDFSNVFMKSGDFNDPDYVKFGIGVGYHEGGHIAETKDVDQEPLLANQFLLSIWNCLEDVRMETIIKKRFPGSRPYLNYLAEKVIGNEADSIALDTQDNLIVLHNFVLMRARGFHNDNIICIKESDALEVEMINRAGIEKVAKCKELIAGVENTHGPDDCTKIATQIISLFDFSEPKTQSSDSKDGQSGDSKDGQSCDSKDGQSGDSKDGQSGNSKDGKSSDSKDGQSGNSKDGQSGEPKDGQSGEPKDGQSGDSKDSDSFLKGMKNFDKNRFFNFDDKMGSLMKGLAKGKTSVDADIEKNLLSDLNAVEEDVVKRSTSNLSVIEANKQKNHLKLLFRKLLIDKARVKKSYFESGSRLSSNRLVDIVSSPTKAKPFVERTRKKTESAAVSIIIDSSSSMNNNGLYFIANTAGFAIASALHGLPNVDVEVRHMVANSAFLTKSFASKPVLSRFGVFPSGRTPTASLVGGSITSIMSLNKDKRLIIVITDGKANDVSELEKLVNEASLLNIGVNGIGIGVSKVHGIPDHCVISDIGELSSKLEQAVKTGLF